MMSPVGTFRKWFDVQPKSVTRATADIERATAVASLIPRQLLFAPMRVLALRIEFARDVTVQRLHDADAREHRRPTEVRDQDQRLHSGLPLRRGVDLLWKPDNVVASV